MIRLVVALQAEARPLIDRLALVADSDATGFHVYRGKDCALVVSGVGQIAAASATAYLQAFLGEGDGHPWLNVGVAGHGRLPLGTPVLAHKVSVETGSKRWYPGMVVDWGGETAEVRTLASPSMNYQVGLLYDMEAAGFYPTACRFSSTELVHCLKIVSDNRGVPVSEVTREQVVTLIDTAIPVLKTLLSGLARLDEQTRVMREPPAGFREALQNWHFTVSQRHRLRRALHRYRTVAGIGPQWPKSLLRASGSEVLHWLEEAIEASPTGLVKAGTPFPSSSPGKSNDT